MSELTDKPELQKLTATLAKPYVVTRSKLGSTTKLIEEQFICSQKELDLLYTSIGEKITSFNPSKAGFQYLISFTDSTHYENSNLSTLEETVSGSNKQTDKLILNWSIGHEYDGIENEMSITVRISNPMNPFVLIQAMMSRDHQEADKLAFEDGTVSVSINGATQTVAEEIFSIVQRWASACPQPQSITGISNTIYKHFEKISFLNYWILPVLYTTAAFYYLKSLPADAVQPYGIVSFVGFLLIRSAAKKFNRHIEKWCVTSRRFSLFMFTGGDSNQQTKIAAKSKNNTIKLVSSVTLSFILNIIAGYVVALYLSS